MDVAIEGSEDLHPDVLWSQIGIRLALAFLEKRLDFCDLNALVIITIKHLKDAHNCLISHLILLEGLNGVRELL